MTDRASCNDSGPEIQRLDKWLWFARLVKTRTRAARLVTAGKVRINRQKIDKPAQAVRCGDVITASVGRRVRVLKICALGAQRGPAPEALMLYEDLAPDTLGGNRRSGDASGGDASGEDGKALVPATAAPDAGVRARGAGRPTKRDRRRIERLQGPIS